MVVQVRRRNVLRINKVKQGQTARLRTDGGKSTYQAIFQNTMSLGNLRDLGHLLLGIPLGKGLIVNVWKLEAVD